MNDSGDMRPILRTTTEDFYGKPVRIVFPPGDEPRMCVADAINALGPESFPQDRLIGFYHGYGQEFLVGSNGSAELVRMAIRRDIINLILQSHSPKLERFREWASRVLTDVIQQGYHVDPRLAGAASLTPDMVNDPIIAMRVKQLELEGEVHQLRIENNATRATAVAARDASQLILDQVRGHHDWYALAPWARKKAGISLSEQMASYEATHYLKPLCLQHGIDPSEFKVHHTKYVDINSYPEWALWEWAEGYAQRHPNCGYRGRPKPP